jgi:glutamate-5-semialdehyde dehydrogenase
MNKEAFTKKLIALLKESNVTILADNHLSSLEDVSKITDESVWYEEFLDYKILLGEVKDMEDAIDKINLYGGGHSAAILTENDETASYFMNNVDSAAVYHNASTRFTDGGQFGLGGELAISTDKLHQRGPIGLQHLVTNKWYIKGNGQIR